MIGLGVTEWLAGHTSVPVVKRHKKVKWVIFATYWQWTYSQLWQISEYHHALGLFPAIFIIPTTGIYAGPVESSSNLPLYFHKINFNSILPSIFGLNFPKSPLQVFKENFVCISHLQRKITEVQPSLIIAVLIKFLKTHTHILQWNVYYFSPQQVMFLHSVGVLCSIVELRLVNKRTPI